VAALELGYAVGTTNLRHFRQITPGFQSFSFDEKDPASRRSVALYPAAAILASFPLLTFCSM
jgi:hypothetical protein